MTENVLHSHNSYVLRCFAVTGYEEKRVNSVIPEVLDIRNGHFSTSAYTAPEQIYVPFILEVLIIRNGYFSTSAYAALEQINVPFICSR